MTDPKAKTPIWKIPLAGIVLVCMAVALIFSTPSVFSDPETAAGNEVWQRTYGGTSGDHIYALTSTADGGALLAGWMDSSGAGNFDGWLIKVDAAGKEVWQQTYGGTASDYIHALTPTADGGALLAGFTDSSGAGGRDGWLIKVDAAGNEVWQRTYGGTDWDFIYALTPTADGGALLGGRTASTGAGSDDGWLIEVDAAGNEVWQRTFGGKGDDYIHALTPTADGGTLLAGSTYSSGAGSYDGWLIKVDAAGNEVWQQNYGGTSGDYIHALTSTADGGALLAGETRPMGAGKHDGWLIKVNAAGNEVWQQIYDATTLDIICAISPTADGGALLAGLTGAIWLGVEPDGWLIKVDAAGNEVWQKTYGGTNLDEIRALTPTADGGALLAGNTYSSGAGGYDGWLIKVANVGAVPPKP